MTNLAVLTTLLLLAGATDAWAYIDPGTGSYLFQLLIAGGLAAVYTVRRYWHTVKTAVVARFVRAGAGNPPTGSNAVE